jgi:hypothetical protein
MGTKGSRQDEQYVRFFFDFREAHSPDIPSGGWGGVEGFIQQLNEHDWEPQPPGDRSGYCDSEIQSIEDLANRIRAYCVGECNQPEDVVQIPIKKLLLLMTRTGYSFVGGSLIEFEGNHNDTIVYVFLQPKAPKQRTGRRSKPADADAVRKNPSTPEARKAGRKKITGRKRSRS